MVVRAGIYDRVIGIVAGLLLQVAHAHTITVHYLSAVGLLMTGK